MSDQPDFPVYYPTKGASHVYDENGIDRVQIRQMLGLTPAERLRCAEQLANEVMKIWKLNGTRPLR